MAEAKSFGTYSFWAHRETPITNILRLKHTSTVEFFVGTDPAHQILKFLAVRPTPMFVCLKMPHQSAVRPLAFMGNAKVALLRKNPDLRAMRHVDGHEQLGSRSFGRDVSTSSSSRRDKMQIHSAAQRC